MKKSILLISMMLVSLFGYAAPLNTPTLQIGSTNPPALSATSVNIWVDDTNPNEVFLEMRIIGDGTTRLLNLGNGASFNYILSGLKPKTFYKIQVRAVAADDANSSLFSNFVNVTTLALPPAPPTNLKVLKNCPEFIGISWDVLERPEDADFLQVYRSFNGVNYYPLSGILSKWQRTFWDSDAKPGMAPFYQVIASSYNQYYNTKSPALQTNWNTFARPKPADWLVSVAERKTENSLDLYWQNAQEDDECNSDRRDVWYISYKAKGDADFKSGGYTDAYNTITTLKGLKANTVYEVCMFTVNRMDNRLQSTWKCVTDSTLGPPKEPSGLTITPYKDIVANSSYKLTWKDLSGLEDYQSLESSKNDSLNFKQIAKIKAKTETFLHTGIEEGVIYFYRLKAINSKIGDSKYSNMVSYKTDYTEAPYPPYSLSAKSGTGGNVLNWNDGSMNEESFVIEKSTDNITYASAGTVAKNTTTYTDGTGIKSGTTYYYRVKAVNPKGSSAFCIYSMVKATANSGRISDSDVSLFPNPTFDNVKISLGENLIGKDVEVKIYDNFKKLLFTKTYSNAGNEISINGSNLNKGALNVQISSGNESVTKKIIRN